MPADNVANDTDFEKASDATGGAAAPTDTEDKGLTSSPLFWFVVLLGLGLVVPFIPVPNRATALAAAALLTIVYVLAAVHFAAHLTRLQLAPTKLITGLVLSGVVWVVLQF